MAAACAISPCLQGRMGIVAQPTRVDEMMMAVMIRTSFCMWYSYESRASGGDWYRKKNGDVLAEWDVARKKTWAGPHNQNQSRRALFQSAHQSKRATTPRARVHAGLEIFSAVYMEQ